MTSTARFALPPSYASDDRRILPLPDLIRILSLPSSSSQIWITKGRFIGCLLPLVGWWASATIRLHRALQAYVVGSPCGVYVWYQPLRISESPVVSMRLAPHPP